MQQSRPRHVYMGIAGLVGIMALAWVVKGIGVALVQGMTRKRADVRNGLQELYKE